MRVRILLIAVIVTALMFGSAQSAFAWGNGGNKGNAYGTHDWVLDKAIALARAQGGARWVNKKTTLLATDDPDTSAKTSKIYHVYKTSISARGGPQKAADEYTRLVAAYNKGDYKEASRLLGVMSHYYSDVNQPFHTVTVSSRATYRTGYAGRRRIEKIHFDYEKATDAAIRSYGDRMLSTRARRPVTDVRSMAVSSAKTARKDYKTLLKYFSIKGNLKGKTARTITRRVLSRSVNDLADIILAVESGQGISPAPASLSQTMWRPAYHFPRKGQRIRSEVRTLDAQGRPMEGVLVTFRWPGPNGTTRRYSTYSDATGLAFNWQYISDLGSMRELPVTSQVSSGGQRTLDDTTYMETPVLKSGGDGFRAWLSTTRPARGSSVEAYAKAVSTSGKVVAGLPVTFTWSFADGPVRTTAVTGNDGVARSLLYIGDATPGTPVNVKGQAYSGGSNRSFNVSFVPQ